MSDELPPAQRFAALIAEVNESAGSLAAWNDRVDWDRGTRQMADFYTPLSSQNRLYVEWVYSRLSSLLNAVRVAAIRVHRVRDRHLGQYLFIGDRATDADHRLHQRTRRQGVPQGPLVSSSRSR